MHRLERYPRGSNERKQLTSELASKIDGSDIKEKTFASIKLIQRIGEEEKSHIREDLVFILQKLNLNTVDPSILKNEYIKIINKQAGKKDPFASIGDVWKVGEKIIPLLPEKHKSRQKIHTAWVTLADTLGNNKKHKMFEYSDSDPAELKIARLMSRAKLFWEVNADFTYKEEIPKKNIKKTSDTIIKEFLQKEALIREYEVVKFKNKA